MASELCKHYDRSFVRILVEKPDSFSIMLSIGKIPTEFIQKCFQKSPRIFERFCSQKWMAAEFVKIWWLTEIAWSNEHSLKSKAYKIFVFRLPFFLFENRNVDWPYSGPKFQNNINLMSIILLINYFENSHPFRNIV